MMPKIYESIERAVANGVQPQYLAAVVIAQGYPPVVVNEAVNAWLSAHGRLHHKTAFREWLRKYKRKALPATTAVISISVISSAVLLLRPWPTKIMVDSAFGDIKAPGPLAEYTHKPVLILITSLMTVAIFLLGFLFGIIRDYMVLRLGFWLNRDIKEESFRHILHLPLYHQERLAKGDYIYRQNILTNSLSDLVLDTTSSIAQSVIMILGVVTIMFLFNVKLTLISVVMIPFLFVLVRVFGPVLGKISRALTQTASDTSSTVTESIDNAETVQSFTLEEKQIIKADNLWRKTYRLSKRGLFWSRGYRFTNSLLIIIGTSVVMYFGGKDALYGFNHPEAHTMTLGQLLIFMTYMGYLLGPVEELAAQIAARNQKLIDVSRIYEVLTDHEGIENIRKDNHFIVNHGRIDFQNVSYAYNKNWILKNINLSVEPGQKIGIVGQSGSGKTTLLKLIPLFIEPTQGRVMIDNVDVQTVSLTELRQRIAWISQSPQLFNESIIENLADGDIYRQMSRQEIQQAMHVAYIDEFVNKLPLGENSTAGEGGNSLSGGQKQRVAVARGLLKKARILCMDEPTAALDSKSENYIVESLPQLFKDKTVLVATHRRAILSLMDKIYVMDSGEIKDVEQYGGLDAYLKKITESEGSVQSAADAKAEEAKAIEADERRQLQRRLEQLEVENAQLNEKLAIVSQQKVEEAGTIRISHQDPGL